MKKVTVNGIEFTLLESDEIDCEHGKWRKVFKDVVVNPNGEFVEGYGNDPVSVRVEIGRQCGRCGHIRYD